MEAVFRGDGWLQHEVMSEKEVMADESVTLASEGYDTRKEAERALEKGRADGTYKDIYRPGSSPR